MVNTLDCFLIGHNEMDFNKYENLIRTMGVNSGAYRDLSKNFIQYHNKLYTIIDIFNYVYNKPGKILPALNLGNTFSSTIAYLGTFLNRHGFSFDYVNSFQNEKEDMRDKLKKENIITIAIITTLYTIPFPIIEIINYVRKYNRSAKIIVGGPFINTHFRILSLSQLHLLFEYIGADYYVNSSQGESTLILLIDAIKKCKRLENINNITFKDGDKFISTSLRQEKNILSENTVNWNLFADRITENVSVRTAISCPFKCAFCGFPQRSGIYQIMDIKSLEIELNTLANIASVKIINFIDDTFNIPYYRFKNILKMINKNNYNFRWFSNFRCQYADDDIIALMKNSGCLGVFLGLESGDNRMLKVMNKKACVQDYYKGITMLRNSGIITHGNFIVGFPGETDGTAAETTDFIRRSGLDFFRSQLWFCESITPIWNDRDMYKIKGSQFEWSHSTMDSKIACNIIDKTFMSITNPVWIPQYNFDFNGIFHLINRGLTLPQIKKFLTVFNEAVKANLKKLEDINIINDIFKPTQQIFLI